MLGNIFTTNSFGSFKFTVTTLRKLVLNTIIIKKKY